MQVITLVGRLKECLGSVYLCSESCSVALWGKAWVLHLLWGLAEGLTQNISGVVDWRERDALSCFCPSIGWSTLVFIFSPSSWLNKPPVCLQFQPQKTWPQTTQIHWQKNGKFWRKLPVSIWFDALHNFKQQRHAVFFFSYFYLYLKPSAVVCQMVEKTYLNV